ncbi:MAG: helix-hairpin-helix domain-containing protein [Eubacteriales bacterium]|nr:helix-hairpin-helix domain-containing protein [Eubacteriales bacterium]
MKIRCVVERITYQNPENGYTILKCRVKDYTDLVPVIGNLLDVNVGSVLLVEGNWKVDSKYGRQFVAESWERQKEIKNVMLFLQDHGVSTSFAAKIYKQYGNDSIPTVKENPYRLADDIWGIGFKTADQIAEKLGFEKNSFVRLRSGIMYTLSELSNEGHVYAEKKQLIKAASALLEAEEEYIIMTMEEMLAKEDLIQEKTIHKMDAEGNAIEAIYLPPFYYAEIGVAGKLKKLAALPATDRLWTGLMKARAESGNQSLSVDVGAIEKKVGMTYDDVQRDAIRRAATAKVMVLTGGPGTGKT